MNTVRIGRFPSPGYACAEAINTLCTNLSFSGESVKKIMVTSCHAGEGKSFISMNIMRTMAKFGKRVVLVDADLRRSAIAARYGFQYDRREAAMGLVHLLAGMAEEADVIYATDIPGAAVIPVGRTVSNAMQLLNSPKFGRLLDSLAKKFDYVIVDAAPVGTVIDAAEIAKSCDGTLLVVDYNAIRRQELIDVRNQLEQTGCPILGTALNRVELDNYLSRKYYYKSYYSNYGDYDRSGGKTKAGQARSARRSSGGAKRS